MTSIAVDSVLTLEVAFFNNVGQRVEAPTTWSSSDTAIITVDDEGTLTAVSPGMATLTVMATEGSDVYTDTIDITVTEVDEDDPVDPTPPTPSFRTFEGEIETTTFYTLEGDFVYEETQTGVLIDIAANYRASASLPGLYIYLSNNRNSIAGALEISEVTTFSGAHSFEVEGVGFEDYSHIVYFCKPFNVKVGEASLSD